MIGKAGRPNYHVKAFYISLVKENGTFIYPLDSQGNIEKDSNGNMKMNVVTNYSSPIIEQPPVTNSNTTKEKAKTKKNTNSSIPKIKQIPDQAPIEEQINHTEYEDMQLFTLDNQFSFDYENPFDDCNFEFSEFGLDQIDALI